LDESNEHLQKISLYLRDFWWVLIGIPLILITIAIIASIKFESMKKERQEQQQEQQEQSGQGTE
jgi:flagellar basal body-associated protein FliL